MTNPDTEDTIEVTGPPSGSFVDSLRAHPIISGVIAAGIVIGSVLGFNLLPEDWAVARRLAAGAVAGGGVGLIVTANRIIGP